MNLKEIEKLVILEFLVEKAMNKSDAKNFADMMVVTSRMQSKVGFIADIQENDACKVDDVGLSYNWGKIGAVLNKSIDTGYLLYVERGFLSAVEGYVYEGEWPDEIASIEVYPI